MKLALFYDTETQGLPLFNEPSEDPRQPHLVQLAATLVDLDTKAIISSMDVIVKPDGWTIPEEVAAIHGISTEMAHDLGVPEVTAVDMFIDLWSQRLRIAHNEQFDARILRIALKRYVDPRSPEVCEPFSDIWKSSKSECTAKLSTPILKLPPTDKMRAAGRFHHKTANLSEAYEFFTGKPLENAHSAMADVQGCVAVYFGVQNHKAQEAA